MSSIPHLHGSYSSSLKSNGQNKLPIQRPKSFLPLSFSSPSPAKTQLSSLQEPLNYQNTPLMASPAEVTSEPHHEVEDDDIDLGFALMRQNSIYSLTLDEIQNTVIEPGKDFGSMNMDEFLNNIWTVEETANNGSAVNLNSAPPPSAIARQGSITVPAPLCRKTVDEVWAEIHGVGDVAARGDVDRQQTMGEMTLEDFLVRAGVVREGFGPSAVEPAACVPMQQPNFGGLVNYEMQYAAPLPQRGAGEGKGYGTGSPVSSEGGTGSGHVDNGGVGPAGVVGTGVINGGRSGNGNGRKRGGDGGGGEKGVERRQRRMIKNRESAARSRARKQVPFCCFQILWCVRHISDT